MIYPYHGGLEHARPNVSSCQSGFWRDLSLQLMAFVVRREPTYDDQSVNENGVVPILPLKQLQ